MTRAPVSLPIERIFAAPDLNGSVLRGVSLSPDGAVVSFLQAKPDDPTILDLWCVATMGDEPARLLIDSRHLGMSDTTLTEAERARRERQRTFGHGIVDYHWDRQGKRLLVPVAGHLFVVDLASGAITHRIIRNANGGDATDPRFSPDGKQLSFVRDGTLMVADTASGAPHPLSPEAAGAISYGVAEFVAQEEFARDTGYWWSPDSRAIAYTRVDETKVPLVSRIDIGVAGTTQIEQRFPFAGQANATVALFVQPLAGRGPIAVDLGSDPDFYLVRVDWSADSQTLYVQRLSRDQQRLDLLAINPVSGASTVILTEQRAPWVTPNLDFTPLDDGGFLWVSERTGFAHLFRYDAEAQLVGAVTTGDFPLGGVDRVPSVVGIDQAAGIVYVVASKDSALEQHLYAVDYRSGGPMRQMTEGHGWWSIRMGQQANAFVGTYADPETPPQTALYGIDGTRRRWLSENALDEHHPYFAYRDGLPQPEFGQLTADDGQALNYVLLKPVDFDPTRRYPAIVQVYGGPLRQLVKRDWRSPTERLWLEAGFVVFQLDNRGTCNRGLAFESVIAGRLGEAEIEDQVTGLRYLQSLPFIAGDSVGVTGWSFGGFMTLNLLTEPGAGFAAGAAGAAPAEWRLYDTYYTERYMGHPDKARDAYEARAILPRLDKLAGRLMLLHGMADDNVLFENATRMIARLQELAIPFDLMLYPGQRHGIVGAAQRQHVWQTHLDFFTRELKSGSEQVG